MRVAGRLAAEVLDMIGEHVKPGVTTEELDRICHDHIVERAAGHPGQRCITRASRRRSAPRSTTSSATASRASKVLKDGDIVNIDVTVIKDGFHGDTSRMYFVGKPPVQAQRLIEICFEAMWRGIAAGAAGRAPGRHRRTPSRPSPRPNLLRGARVLRPWHRPRSTTKTRRCCITASPAPAWS